MPNRRSRWGRLLLVLALIGLCLGAAGAGLLAGAIPDLFGRLGSPSPQLNPVDRLTLSLYLLLRLPELEAPINPAMDSVEFNVESGTPASQVAADLEATGLIDDRQLLTRYLHYRGLDRGIEAGRYLLSGRMDWIELSETLQSAEAGVGTLTVPEGWRREQIAAAAAAAGPSLVEAELLAASNSRPDGYSFSHDLPAQGGLEGFLFPDTYAIDAETDARQLVMMMLDNFEERLDSSIRSRFEARDLRLYQAVTLASIVEREAIVEEERPLIAAVFLNRLALGMNLDADPTVQYALGQQPDGSWWKRDLTAVDLEIDSPYNTYRSPGLPPSPIANPGLSSLQAVAKPADEVYLYFRATCDGSGRHNFAVTFEEHVGNACP